MIFINIIITIKEMSQPFWDKKWGKDKICPITFSRLRSGKDKTGLPYTITLNCGHRFYRKALIAWIIKSNCNCPICRNPIDQLTNNS